MEKETDCSLIGCMRKVPDSRAPHNQKHSFPSCCQFLISVFPAAAALDFWVSLFLDDNGDFKSNSTQCYFHGGRNYGSKSEQRTSNYVNDLIFLYNVAVALKGMSGKSLALQQAKVSEIASDMMASNSITINEFFMKRVQTLLGVSISDVNIIPNQTIATVNSYKILNGI